jgi:NADH-quinone oxidoreductase subunit N
MTLTPSEFMPAAPEMVLLSMACVVLVADLFVRESNRILTFLLAQVSLLMTFIAVLAVGHEGRLVAFYGTFVSDPMAQVLKLFMLAVVFGAFVYSRDYLRERSLFKGEFYVLGLFAVLGMMVMISAHSLLTVYLGLELLSLSLYALVAFDRDSADASEAAMKYFVLGALASGMLLYGMSILYGLSGTLDIAGIGQFIAGENGDNQVPLGFALSFIVLGLAFKFGAVPFHMWIPDVYQGAPTPVTLFIGTAPKLAAFAIAIRLLQESLGGLQVDWGAMLAILAMLSIAIGNVVAIAQTNIKRMLAYSTISHVGFLLLGVLAGTPQGYSSGMFYTLTYALMALGGFGMIILLSRAGFEADQIDDFKGLNDRNPWFAAMMMIIMFSMAGVPPTVGFYAKLAVLQAVIEVDMLWLALLAVFFSIIGAFYYLRVVKLMYFDKPTEEVSLACGADMRITLSINALAVLMLGVFPGGLMALCTAAFT